MEVNPKEWLNDVIAKLPYYQEKDFTCSHDVNPLYLKDHAMTKYIAIFLMWCYSEKQKSEKVFAQCHFK